VKCPRCNQEVEERLYGPCSTCRMELRGNARVKIMEAQAFQAGFEFGQEGVYTFDEAKAEWELTL